MEREQFTFYASFFRAVSRIKNKSSRCEAYDAICAYALTGEAPDLEKISDAAAIAFELSKPNLDASRRKAESGKAGGARKQTGSKPEANAKQHESKPEANAKQEQTETKKENKKKKENKCYIPPNPLEGASPVLQEAFAKWLVYKHEKRQDYKPTGLQALASQVQRAAEEHGPSAVARLIEECMANNWQGIIFERLNGRQKDIRKGMHACSDDEIGNYMKW